MQMRVEGVERRARGQLMSKAKHTLAIVYIVRMDIRAEEQNKRVALKFQ